MTKIENQLFILVKSFEKANRLLNLQHENKTVYSADNTFDCSSTGQMQVL
jgi:hypothetical protein